ncbi:beta-ketoacyl synthase N-terminal-like domain-containing protein [Geomonas agri]|uniref:beta-ketoacyl synthase N-terminal-like domain-containing protein n=1 Tax=Geomonas agri TaxID=2873702 RepID=UPI001CD2A315|nr:beta-ketoacyl synthase N-terminal-like domain-containing protein [Geomonas agri]
MKAYLNGIGWVTGTGCGMGSQRSDQVFVDLPLPALVRRDVFAEPNQRFGRMSDYAKLGLSALAFALRDAGLETWSEKRPFGVVAGTRLGCLATDLDYQRTVLLEGGGLASPNLFAYTLANCFLGDAAILFGLTGSLLAVNETESTGLGALAMALDQLALKEEPVVLAGVCDLAPPEPLAVVAPFLPGAAVLVLAETPGPRCYGCVTVAANGGIACNGTPVDSIAQLIDAALKQNGISQQAGNTGEGTTC